MCSDDEDDDEEDDSALSLHLKFQNGMAMSPSRVVVTESRTKVYCPSAGEDRWAYQGSSADSAAASLGTDGAGSTASSCRLLSVGSTTDECSSSSPASYPSDACGAVSGAAGAVSASSSSKSKRRAVMESTSQLQSQRKLKAKVCYSLADLIMGGDLYANAH